MPVFPVEIFHLIIDQLHYDNKSSPLLPRFIKHPVVPLNSPPVLEPFTSARLSSFLDILRSPAATIIPHVRHINLYLVNSSGRYTTDLTLLALFTGIESISLNLAFKSSDMDIAIWHIIPFLRSLGSLNKMALNLRKFTTFEQVRDIVCACRGLQELEMIGTPDYIEGREENSVRSGDQSSALVHLRALKKNDFGFEEGLLDWVVSCAPPMQITSLTLHLWAFLGHASSGSLLDALAPSLEHLTIEYRAPGIHILSQSNFASYEISS
ncbi:hypothetical protein HWV62_33013 [Athelia sp. TMB]|nr:hypothetical protein HWV62_33013 [Athelia sp. TMB]